MQEIHKGFQDANQATDSKMLLEFLDAADGLESVKAYRQRMLDLCTPIPGQRILDIGCGIGHSALRLASLVAPTGEVVGLDKNAFLIAEARRRARGLSARLTYQIGDAEHLTFPAYNFDICRAERVLMYLDNPQLVLDELLRVVRPNGTLVFFEFDYDGMVVDAPEPELTRRLGHLLADSVPSPWIGRQLPRLLRERGVQAITVIPHMILTTFAMYRSVVSGTVAQALQSGQLLSTEVSMWWRALDEAEAAGNFFAGFPGFIVCGRIT
jgi:Methylase involved in ubiquinone/menaquinone biosynthesis